MSDTIGRARAPGIKDRLFRHARHEAGEFFLGDPPDVFFEDEKFSLVDISASGVGCLAPDGADAATFRNYGYGRLKIEQAGRVLFLGKAKLARAFETDAGVFLGIHIGRPPLDLDELRIGNARAAAGAATLSSLAVPDAYKSFCADVLDFLSGYHERIGRHFGSLGNAIEGASADEIAHEFSDRAAPRWAELLQTGNRFAMELGRDGQSRLAAKEFTRRVVTPNLLGGSGWRRNSEKPLGHALDHIFLGQLYAGAALGATLEERFLHLLSHQAWRSVRARSEHLGELILRLIGERRRGKDSFSVLAIGAGPAFELEAVCRIAPQGMRMRVTLADHAAGALESALGMLRREFSEARVECGAYKLAPYELSAPDRYVASGETLDIIYAPAMTDHVNPLLVQQFIRRAEQFLKPGGALILGSQNDSENGVMWASDFLVDWPIAYRSPEEALGLAGAVGNASAIRLENDRSGANAFVIIEKPAA